MQAGAQIFSQRSEAGMLSQWAGLAVFCAYAAIALAAYGVGLPAFALVRIVASTFYARHDTATPARITVFAMLCNIALKVVLVW